MEKKLVIAMWNDSFTVESMSTYTCPECNQTFVEADEWIFGHDCEAE